MVTLTVLLPGEGQTLTLKGHACGGYPVLISINTATFSQPVALDGYMLVYRSQSNPQVLSAVIGNNKQYFLIRHSQKVSAK